MELDEQYMQRCFQLAAQSMGNVAPNPLVGAVLVYNGAIIGEGAHLEYGKAHAEVNAINAVPEHLQDLIPLATLYVNLEPCSHFGKTPPCVDLIIEKGIKQVVIANKDPFDEVNGSGINKLRQANIDVRVGLCAGEGIELNRRFFTFHQKKRPYIILKWAQSADGFMDDTNAERLYITNTYSNRLVHRWRSEEAAIAVGANTAIIDNPKLTNRLWYGKSPTRVLIDFRLSVGKDSNVLDKSALTIVLHEAGMKDLFSSDFLHYREIPLGKKLPVAFCEILYEENLQSVLIEGGAKTLQQFIDTDLYDEVRILTNTKLFVGDGLPVPTGLHEVKLIKTEYLQNDCIQYFRR